MIKCSLKYNKNNLKNVKIVWIILRNSLKHIMKVMKENVLIH